MSSSSSTASSSRASPSPEPAPKKTTSSKKRKVEQPEIEVDLALPEPPSKRAKRLLKKGKPLPAKPDSDASDDEEGAGDKDKGDKASAAAAKKKERSPYGVWIGNLRFTVTRDELRQWLVDNSGGSITPELVTRVHLPRARRGASSAAAEFENKGFAYVDFATYEANLAAIALSETEWYRRRLLIKDATSFEGRPEEHKLKKKEGDEAGKGGAAAQKAEEPVSTSRKIFVGNLGFQATEDDVRELFSPCGEIEWVKVATFEDSGKCKGYGWVKFAEAVAADWAVKGFVKIKEVEETEEDFMDVDAEAEEKEEAEKEKDESDSSSSSSDSGSESDKDDSESSDDSDEESTETKPTKKEPVKKPQAAAPEKKVKMRKWWVNTLHGRRLKIEHAEDDQTRYKKRYGKGGQQGQQQQRRQQQNGDAGAGGKPQARHNNNSNGQQRRKWGRDDGQQDGASKPAARREPVEASNFHEDISVARLTGAAVKPEGKKITFD